MAGDFPAFQKIPQENLLWLPVFPLWLCPELLLVPRMALKRLGMTLRGRKLGKGEW